MAAPAIRSSMLSIAALMSCRTISTVAWQTLRNDAITKSMKLATESTSSINPLICSQAVSTAVSEPSNADWKAWSTPVCHAVSGS